MAGINMRAATPGLGRLAMAIAGGRAPGGAYHSGYGGELELQSKLAQAMAQIEASNSTADLNRVKAEAERAELAGRAPEVLRRNTMMVHGVPLDDESALEGYLSTGRPLGRYGAGDGVGPVAPMPEGLPEKMGKVARQLGLTLNAIGMGDKNSTNVAESIGKMQDQELVDKAVAAATGGDDMGMSRINTIRGKKEFTPFAAVGTTGTALNQVTGAQHVSHQPTNVLFTRGEEAQIGQRDAAAGASKASAVSSYASAGAAWALEQQRRQEIEQGRRSGDIKEVIGPDGSVYLVNKVTRETHQVVGPDGKPLVSGKGGGSGTGAGKPLTEGQAKANIFGGRMTESDKVLRELEDKGVTNSGLMKNTVQGALGLTPFIGDKLSDAAGSVLNTVPVIGPNSAQQRVEQARRDFINAVLRKESGAVISPQEFSNAERQYFPQPGDSKEVLEQKRRNRQLATQLMLQEVPEHHRYRGNAPAAAPPPAAPAPPGPRTGGATGSWGGPAASAGRNVKVDY